ncbi:MAG: type II toxin-antitoxin system HicA family toxin [Candidatus Sedimenticola sp. PURPLELP]
MSHKREKMLAAIFNEPVSGNLHWREIESLLKSLGAEFHELPGARLRIILNGVEGMLHRPHHSSVMPKQDVRHLRQYLASAGFGTTDK